ncbi:MAG: HyaD/HybD family hydrogenase maturation endopeptidase [Acidobacteria bacterium]|nr:HyaD/HybD family hydrogenase maturation endopeptidase [Acidobacteriota bacterium]
MTAVRVLGVGNLLMGDEGVGVHAVRALENRGLPEGAEAVDAGTAGLGLLGFFGGARRLIFLDCVDMGLPPGTVRRFSPDEVRELCSGREMSLHETGILGILELARTTGELAAGTAVVLYGIQPASLGWSMELSPCCAAAVEEVVDRVYREIVS